VRISRTALAGPLAVALAIPAFAIGQAGPPNRDAQPPGHAYGVICDRQGASKTNENHPDPGTPFSRCVSEHRNGVNGQKSARAAARAACRESHPPTEGGNEFGQCVASTRELILGLRGLKAR
jgi:hypothetical protein